MRSKDMSHSSILRCNKLGKSGRVSSTCVIAASKVVEAVCGLGFRRCWLKMYKK